MKQQELLQLVSKYLARFSEQIKILNKNGEFSINIHAENVLIKILNIVYDCDFENVNYSEGKTYDTIDLRDKHGKMSVQITATSNIKKIKDTLESYSKNEHFKNFSELKILILTGRQERYSQEALDKKIQNNYKFNGGVDIIDLTNVYLLLNKQNDLNKILTVKDLLESQFSDTTSGIILPTIENFKDLCLALKKILDENGHLFKQFGPNSSADGEGPLRWDLSLWYKARRERVVPNNRNITTLIDEFKGVIPKEYKDLFGTLKAHSYAFEKHCEDANFDYTMYQFPKQIIEVIDKHAK